MTDDSQFFFNPSLTGIRIEQVEPGTRIGEHVVDDEHGVQDARGVIYVTAKHHDGIKAVARDGGQVTYSHR